MLNKLLQWVAGKEPVAAATGLAAVVTALAGVLTAFDVVELSAEQIAAIGALAAAVAGWLGRSAVTPVGRPPQGETGGVPLAVIIFVGVLIVLASGLALCADSLFEDEDEVNDVGMPALVLDHDGCDPYYEDCYGPGPEEDYGQDYSSRDRNRNRGRNRGAFSPGPFDRSPVDFSNSCISLDCSGRDEGRRDDRRQPRPPDA